MTARGKRERTRASTNDELLSEDSELRKGDSASRKAQQAEKELSEDFKNEAIRKLIAWDLTAKNGPKGAQPDDPKPPYWDLRQDVGHPEKISDADIKAALREVEKERRQEEKKAEAQRLGQSRK